MKDCIHPVDGKRCPLCGGDNQCGYAADKTADDAAASGQFFSVPIWMGA